MLDSKQFEFRRFRNGLPEGDSPESHDFHRIDNTTDLTVSIILFKGGVGTIPAGIKQSRDVPAVQGPKMVSRNRKHPHEAQDCEAEALLLKPE